MSINVFQQIKDLSIGAVIGAANIIPGVSGGTMALVMGVYQRLLTVLSGISIKTFKCFFGLFRFSQKSRQDFAEEFNRLEGFFLIKIFVGAIVAIVLLASLMEFLINHHHAATYGFFFGLVLLSAVYPYKLIRKMRPQLLIALFLGVASVFAISIGVNDKDLIEKAEIKQEKKAAKAAMKSNPNALAKTTKTVSKADTKSLLFMFLLGSVAITAMVLPGVSGSFLLLVLGGYFDLLSAIAERDMAILSVFLAGCMIGLIISTRMINYLLTRWHDATMTFLLGLVFGSLWVIWPFKHVYQLGDVTVYLKDNTLPTSFGPIEIMTIFSTLAGIAIVACFLWYEKFKKKT